MSGGRIHDIGAAEAKRAAAEASRRAAEAAARQAAEAAARRAAEAASQALGISRVQSSFERSGPRNTLNLDGQGGAPASSLLNENIHDKSVNCLHKAADWVNKSSPELQRRSELVFLKDSRAGIEGQAGHVVVRQGERVLDPGNGKSYSDMKSYLREQSHYSEVGSLAGTVAAKVFSTKAGSPERARALADAKVPPSLGKMLVADQPPITGDVPNAATVKPYERALPGQPGPVSVEFSDSLEKDVKRKDGYVTVSITAETSVSSSGTLEVGNARVGASVGMSAAKGKRMEYEVKMKEGDFEKLKRGEIAPPHPLKPETIPDGTAVKMEQSQFKGSGLEVGLSYHAAELGISSDIKQGKGMSVEVSREGNKLEMTAGPTEFIENNGKVSIGVGPVSVSAGRSDALKEYKLRTAKFDLSNPDGKKAFESFAKDGHMPEKEGSGVSDTLRFDKINYDSKGGQLGLNIGPIQLETDGVTNSGEKIITHHPDGTKSVTADITYGGDHPELRIEQKYDKEGKRIPGTEKFALKFDTKEDNLRHDLVYAFTGDQEKAEAARGNDKPITLNLSASNVQELQRRAREQSMDNGTLGNGSLGGLLSNADGSPAELLDAVSNMAGSPISGGAWLVGCYVGLSVGGQQPLSGELKIG